MSSGQPSRVWYVLPPSAVLVLLAFFSVSIIVAATPPQPGAIQKPVDVLIFLPWSDGVEHSITQGYDGGSLHQGTDRSCCVNDYYALDFDLRLEESVYPTAPGIVVFVGPATGGWSTYGNIVFIDHGNGYQSLYAHLNSMSVSSGQSVDHNTRLGGAGGTGGWPVHLHFALYRGARFQNAPGSTGPYGGQAVVPEPFADCVKNGSASCENLVGADRRCPQVVYWAGKVYLLNFTAGKGPSTIITIILLHQDWDAQYSS